MIQIKKTINKVWLQQKYLIEKLSMDKIAKLVPCHRRVVKRNMLDYGIITRDSSDAHRNYGEKLITKCADCGKEIYRYSKLCKSCARKGKNNPAYTTGLTLKDYFCIDCNKKISTRCGIYGGGRCNVCANKIENLSRTTRQNMSDNHADVSGENNGRFGLPVSEETRSKLSLSHGGTGIPFENTKYGTEFTKELKEQVRKRDNYKCQICGVTQNEIPRKLSVHHIDYDKLNCTLNNLVSLCQSCHMSTNTNREFWIQYFIDTQILMV